MNFFDLVKAWGIVKISSIVGLMAYALHSISPDVDPSFYALECCLWVFDGCLVRTMRRDIQRSAKGWSRITMAVVYAYDFVTMISGGRSWHNRTFYTLGCVVLIITIFLKYLHRCGEKYYNNIDLIEFIDNLKFEEVEAYDELKFESTYNHMKVSPLTQAVNNLISMPTYTRLQMAILVVKRTPNVDFVAIVDKVDMYRDGNGFITKFMIELASMSTRAKTELFRIATEAKNYGHPRLYNDVTSHFNQ